MIFKKLLLTILFTLLIVGPYTFPLKVFAAPSCQSLGVKVSTIPSPILEGTSSFVITLGNVDPGDYRLRIGFGKIGALQTAYFGPNAAAGGKVAFNISNSNVLSSGDDHIATLLKGASGDNEFCGDIKYKIGYNFSECRMIFRPPNLTTQQDFVIDVVSSPKGTYTLAFLDKSGSIKDQNGQANQLMDITVADGNKGTSPTLKFTVPLDGHFELRSKDILSRNRTFCDTNATIRPIGNNNPIPIPAPGGGGPGGGAPGGINCKDDPKSCSKSAGVPCNPKDPTDSSGDLKPNGVGGVWTAIGCIPTSPNDLIPGLMGLAAGIGGGIALLLMILGAFQMLTSAGNPESIKKGKDQFVAAAVGLVFILMSALLLRIIGVDILNIPGFSP